MVSLLQKKILLGYVIIISIILGAFIVVANEYLYFQKLVTTFAENNTTRNIIYKAHLNITKLATLGETVMVWDSSDCDRYHHQFLKTDSILLKMEYSCGDFVRLNQIDSLRLLLKTKEMYLFRIMKDIQSWEMFDSLLTNELPVIAMQTVRMKTITQKKKGIAGLLGKKEMVQVPYITDEIKNFNEKLISARNWRNNQMKTYVDSLRLQNRLLNQKLHDFVFFLDNQIQQSFTERNLEVTETSQESFRLFILMMTIAVFIIFISFFIIRFDLRKKEKIKSQLQQIIQENEDLLDMRKKIILTISHDIRGPLGNIHNCADLVSETREKKKREIYLEDIRHSCQHILHLVNNLMDACRINEAGDLRNDTSFYLDRFLKRISDEFSRKANIKALIFYYNHENSSFTVKGDSDKLEQVLDNLLTNAIKFTPSGSIKFHSRYSDGKLQIEIRDTGIGMDKETLKKVFDPFERAAQNVNSEGFGLGLFLTKGLVKVLDGTLNVESKLGKGSTFRLEFPLPETDELLEGEQPDNNPITVLPKKVLVVDDDLIQLKIAEDMLERKGIACTTCMNVKEVVLALRQSNYDIVLTDIQMPESDGFSLLKLLRNSDIGNSRTVPVAVMTARGDGNSGIYEKEGFSGCLHKPFNIHGLLSFLSSVISQTRTTNVGCFDFSYLLENTDDRRDILSLVITESEKELEELGVAIKTNNRESMRKTIHRMVPVWEMLGKGYILREFQTMLHDKESKDEIIHENATRITGVLRNLMEETKNELKKYEDINC